MQAFVIRNNDIINLKNFESKLLVFTILDILQLKKIDDCESIYSVTPLYLLIMQMDILKKR